MESGIDWSIFKDGEEDAFGWLLRTNTSGGSPLAQLQHDDDVASVSAAAAASAAATAALAGVNATSGGLRPLDASPDVLPLDDIHIDDEQDAAMLGIEYAAAAAATTATAAGARAPVKREARASQRLTAHALAAHLQSSAGAQRRDSRYAAASVSASADADGSDDELDDDASESVSTRGRPRAGGKRKQSAASVSASVSGVGGGEDEQERKQLRRVKNLASVREFRKRKMKQMEANEHRLRRLEAENLDLKMRLKIGKEAIVSEQREKQEIKEQMREMLAHGASEQDIARFLNMYKVTYSDYGPRRREKLRFHLERIRELLLPTQVTKLCLYSVEQGGAMIARDHVIQDDPMSMPDSSAAPMSLWGILAHELAVSDAQQRQILERRTAIKKVQDDLNHTLYILQQLEAVTEEKNTALETQVAELQQILTPSQATKFIIWVKENPAFMYMLDKLVDKTLRTADAADAGADADADAMVTTED